MIANSPFEFLLRLTRDYFSHGYFYYFVVKIPGYRTQKQVAKKLTEEYKVSNHSETRNRRKNKGLANCSFVIFKDTVVIVATEGEHETLKRRLFKDIRKHPLIIEKYEIKAITLKKKGRLKVTVFLPEYRYKAAKKKLEKIALHSPRVVKFNLQKMSPYTFEGIQNQRFYLLDMVNTKRKRGRLKPIKWEDSKPYWNNNKSPK